MLVAIGGSVLLCSPVCGDLSFSFSVDLWSYRASPGQPINVPVYLQEVVTAPEVSLLLTESGLFSAGVLVQRTASSLGQPAVITGASANSDFDDLFGPTITVAADEASIFEMRDLGQTSGVLADETFPGSGVRRILLGTFTLSAGPTVGELTTFLVGDNVTDDTRTWTSLTLLDDYPINSTSFTVATVPVPPAVRLGLIGFGAGGLGLWRGRAHRV